MHVHLFSDTAVVPSCKHSPKSVEQSSSRHQSRLEAAVALLDHHWYFLRLRVPHHLSPAASTPACSPPRVPRRSSALLHLLVSTPPSLVAIAAAQGQGDFSVLAAFSAFWGAAFSVQTAVHGAVSLRRGRRSPPEAMRAGHVCSVLASLMLLWLGVAAAQEASSWKTLSGTRPPTVLFFSSRAEPLALGRRQFMFAKKNPLLRTTSVLLLALFDLHPF